MFCLPKTAWPPTWSPEELDSLLPQSTSALSETVPEQSRASHATTTSTLSQAMKLRRSRRGTPSQEGDTRRRAVKWSRERNANGIEHKPFIVVCELYQPRRQLHSKVT